MEPFALPSDIEAVWRPLTDDESEVAVGLIEQASLKLRVLVPTIDEMVANDTTKAGVAKAAVVNAVKRVLQNPDGVLTKSFAIDDYREDIRRDAANSTGSLYIDPRDLVGLVRSNAWGMIRMKRAI